MISTYTTEFKEDYLNQISYNLTAFLINAPDLGLDDSPTAPQLTARKGLTMLDAAALEIGADPNKGYARVFVNSITIVDNVDESSSFEATANFVPDATFSLDPFTHICWAYNTNQTGATGLNGNNQGDTIGTLIKVEPVVSAPLTVTYPAIYTHTTTFAIKLNV